MDNSFNSYQNRPFWEIVGPQILNSTYRAVNYMGIWISKYKPRNSKTSEYDEWQSNLNTSFISLSGHLCEEEEEEWVKLYKDLYNHYYGGIILPEKRLCECTFLLVKYLKHIGLTNIEVKNLEFAIGETSKKPQIQQPNEEFE